MKKYPKTIFVTGCAGFIGSNFVKEFKIQYPKTKIVGIDNFSTGRREALNKNIVFYEGSITDEKLLETIFHKHKIEYVFHFAALPSVPFSVKYPAKTAEANILGTINLLEKSKEYKIKRFIFSSSSSVYGGAKKMPTKESENAPNPQSPYALQKLNDEQFCKMFSNLFNLETVCLRYFNVFGPGQYGGSAYSTVISAWLESLYFPDQKKAFIEGDGKKTRDLCYVKNVVEANICAMKTTKKMSGDVFNIAEGRRIKILDVYKLIEKYTNKKLLLKKLPDRIGDVRHTHADISKAKKYLGYSPKYSFEKGLIEMISWFNEREENTKNGN